MNDTLELRKATWEDRKLLFDWRNEETTRRNSFHSQIISWEEHERWYRKALQDATVAIYILQEQGQDVGQIRTKHERDTYEISYSIEPDKRGRGLGCALLLLLEEKLLQEGCTGATLIGEVKSDNLASRRVFQKAGYREDVREHDKIIFKKNVGEQSR